MFPGQYYDRETGLHYNYFRYYDPSIGRYITSDPYGLYGGLSTYVYVNANPLSWVDPAGLRPATPTEMFGPQPVNILDGATPHDPGLLKDWERLKNVAQTAAGLVGGTKAAQACGNLISRNKDRLLNNCKHGVLAGSIFCSKPGIDRDIESGPIRDVGRQRMEMEQLKRDSGTNRQQTIDGNR